MKMTEKLKPCPFCGGEAQIIRCNSGKYQCFCRNCGCAQTMFFDSPEEVPEEWNARPIENELVEKIEKLERENHILRLDLAEIARGFDEDGFEYKREGMMRIAKEALKGESK